MRFLKLPPLLIMLDILFQNLMVTMTQASNHITINYPEDELFRGGYILHIDKQSNTKYFENGEFLSLNGKLGQEYISLPCRGSLCKQTDLPTENIRIAITGTLYENISKVSFLACSTNSNYCSNLVFDISSKGDIDSKLFQEKNKKFQSLVEEYPYYFN